MRFREIIREDIEDLRKNVIGAVRTTSDEQLLDKIYTVLNQSGLSKRIATTLTTDTDTKGYVEDITKIIIDTPGTYQEKWDFINAFPKGYVDVKLMLSGQYISFDELLQGGEFTHKVFQALKGYSPAGVKGPGEFAMAVMSPHIKITGKGDFNIGDKVIEVKASAGKTVSSGGGRLGTPGTLHSDSVARIIMRYFPNLELTQGVNLGLKGFSELAAKLPPEKRKKMAEETFGYIFGRGINISELVNATMSGQALTPGYLKANWERYQTDTGFDGVMLINFARGALQYFDNAEKMLPNIYGISNYLISKDKGAQARQILSQVTLKGE